MLGHFGWTDRAQVQGKNIRITRLDAEGKPTGAPFEIHGSMTGRFESPPQFLETPDSVGDALWKNLSKRWTAEVLLKDVSPDVWILLYGGTLKPRPWWWWRFLPRFIKHKIKWREIRRGYGG